MARAICHGGRGQIRQAYREGQEDKLAALGLVLNAVVLWNTRDPDAAVARLRAEGHDIKDEDVARLSPLKDRHIDFLGRYLFNIRASSPGRDLRPLRDRMRPSWTRTTRLWTDLGFPRLRGCHPRSLTRCASP